ncbi:glycosyltransferase family 2 protein [Haloarcula sp. JP-L23]|nr:glycosyltransferase family 2 protein [Haloarcula sp. JP-L23]
MAETIEESLTSIISQLDDEFEVLVVDDGSTDGSLDILASLADIHKQLRYVVRDHSNLAEARNTSFELEKGSISSNRWTLMTAMEVAYVTS